MDSKTFIDNALRTESRPERLGMNLGGTLRVLSLLAAAAAVADTFKRGVFYGKGLNKPKLEGELRTLQDALYDAQTVLQRLDVPEDTPVPITAPNLRLLHGAVGIFGESGEMIEALIKQIQTGELDTVNFGEETGDVDWYKAIIHDETGVDETVTREAVVAKLKARYGDKFTSDAATSRDLAAERAVLEESLSA